MNSFILLLALTPGAVSVDEFGAKGDGITNDAPAIQAAIDFLLSDTFLPREYRNGYNRGGTLLFSDHKRYRCDAPLVINRRGHGGQHRTSGRNSRLRRRRQPATDFYFRRSAGNYFADGARRVHQKPELAGHQRLLGETSLQCRLRDR